MQLSYAQIPRRRVNLMDIKDTFRFVAPRVRDAAVKTAAQLNHLGIRYALAGGVAVGAHGYIRATTYMSGTPRCGVDGRARRYGTGSGSDRAPLERASHKTTRSLPLPVPYRFIQILVCRSYRDCATDQRVIILGA